MGGLQPALSNVMTVPDWRISGCAGAALVRLRVARSVAAMVVRSFIVEGCTRPLDFDYLRLDIC